MDPGQGDIGKTSEAVAKLAELVADWVKRKQEPKRIRAEAQAKAEAMLILTDAGIASQQKRTSAEIEDFEVRLRARDRFVKEQVLFQTNMEDIVERAVDALPGEVSERPVPPDWIAEFFGHARHVSDPEMQQLWAHLLAGEVTTPGSFSRRAMNTLRQFAKEDAQFLETICHSSFRHEEQLYLSLDRNNLWALSPGDLAYAEQIGILGSPAGTHVRFTGEIQYFDLKANAPGSESLPVVLFTAAGQDLARLAMKNLEPDLVAWHNIRLALSEVAAVGEERQRPNPRRSGSLRPPMTLEQIESRLEDPDPGEV